MARMGPVSSGAEGKSRRPERPGGAGRAQDDPAESQRGLLLGESLPLHVRPDLLRHLGGADGRPAHDGLHAVLASLEVDRVSAKRLFLRHAFCPPSSWFWDSPPGASRRAEGIIARLRGSAREKYNP